MRKEVIFLAGESIAQRLGVTNTSYRTPEGKYIIMEHELKMLQFYMTPDEFITGLDLKKISEGEAKSLIKRCTLGTSQIAMSPTDPIESVEAVELASVEAEQEATAEVTEKTEETPLESEEKPKEEVSESEEKEVKQKSKKEK